jgi:branched-chain amino acid transport system permease protein
MGETIVSGIVTGSVYGMLALGIVLVFQGSKVLNLAQTELGTFGLFVAASLVEDHGWPWIAGAAVALVVVGAISGAFEALVVRRMVDAPRVTVAVATIGLLLLLLALELKIWGPSPRHLRGPFTTQGPEIAGYVVSVTQIVALVVAAAVGFGLAAFLRRTDFGLGVLAAAQDPTAARLVGVPVARVSAFTWITAGVLGALAALLVEPTVGAFAPGFLTTGPAALFIPALAAALLGGLTSLPRAFMGGLAIGVLEAAVKREFIDSSVPGVQAVAVFAVIIVVLLVQARSGAVRGEIVR